MCGKEIQVFVERGYTYKEITVPCGSTSPSGFPWLCDTCEKKYEHRDWRREAELNGENFDSDY
jgi:hypothetical protein